MFKTPDWNAPFDPRLELDAIPDDAKVRGMFFQFLHEAVRSQTGGSLDGPQPSAFEWAPMQDYVKLVLAAAPKLHPGQPVREQLRRVGHTLFDDFERTMVGKAIFAVSGRDFRRVLTLAHKEYAVSYDPCNLSGRVEDAGVGIVTLDPVWVLADSYQVGAWEGAARFCGKQPTIRVDRKGVGRAVFEIRF